MSGLLVIRQQVAPVADYSEYRQVLRVDFWFSCAYCTVTEVEAGGLRFTIDHYEPRLSRPDLRHVYSNLMWACHHCNELKSDICPPAEARADGHRFLRPDEDDEAEHVELDDVLLKHKTPTGDFTIQHLDLNRQPLRRLRDARRRIDSASEHVHRGLTALRRMSIDRLPRPVRARYQQIVSELSDKQRMLVSESETLQDEILKELSRSNFVDEDPEAEERTQLRRSNLAKLKAQFVDPFRAPRQKR